MRTECLASGCVEEVPEKCNECPLSQMGRTLKDFKTQFVEKKVRKVKDREDALVQASNHFKVAMDLFGKQGNVTLQYQETWNRIVVEEYRNTYTVHTEYEWEVQDG